MKCRIPYKFYNEIPYFKQEICQELAKNSRTFLLPYASVNSDRPLLSEYSYGWNKTAEMVVKHQPPTSVQLKNPTILIGHPTTTHFDEHHHHHHHHHDRVKSSDIVGRYYRPIAEFSSARKDRNLLKNVKPPIFLSRPETSITVDVDNDLTVSFRLSGHPKPNVTWMKGLTDITRDRRTYKVAVNDYTRLTLKRVQLSDTGTYFIVAKNIYGTDRAFFSLKVNHKRGVIRGISSWPSSRSNIVGLSNRRIL